MTHVTCRLTAKNRDQPRNPKLSNRVWATFLGGYGLPNLPPTSSRRGHLTPLECEKFYRPGLCPGPRWGSLQRSPDLLLGCTFPRTPLPLSALWRTFGPRPCPKIGVLPPNTLGWISMCCRVAFPRTLWGVQTEQVSAVADGPARRGDSRIML